jgi:uncharacterized protein
METLIGRKKEVQLLEAILASPRSEFVAVTGRRRVGKTFLIDTVYGPYNCFNFTGVQNGSLTVQLYNFSAKLRKKDPHFQLKKVENWQVALFHFQNYLETLDKTKKQVIFLDELPWIHTPKSDFIQLLAYLWNDYLSKQSHFILVICGSATSWIAKKIIDDAGGLHNRITKKIHLYTFKLPEMRAFLLHKSLQFNQNDTARLYMSLGGVPFYLEHLQRGESFSTAIEQLCFSPVGILHNEYHNLFKALFNNADVHQAIVATLAAHPQGMSHQDLQKAMKLKQNTGSYQRAIEELIISDFIIEIAPFGKKKKGAIIRLMDEYSIFYHHFIKPNRTYTEGMWQQLAESQSYKIWSGYAFETLCIKHINLIKAILGIRAVYTEIYSINVTKTDEQEGFQIDLVIDRKDNAINLCEIKFYDRPFIINKAYYKQLVERKQRFMDFTKTTKQVFWTFITNHGLLWNEDARAIVDASITLEDIFNQSF